MERAAQAISIGDYRGAQVELKNVLGNDPENAEARFMLARASLALGDTSGAEKELRFAYRAGLDPSKASELDARVKLALGQYSELLGDLEASKAGLPASRVAVLRGRALLGLRRLDEAEAAFREALVAPEEAVEAGIGVAEVFASRGDIEAALGQIGQVVSTHPESAEASLVQGSLQVRRGRFQEAKQSLEAAKARSGANLPFQRQALLLGLLTEAGLAIGDVKGASQSHQQLVAIAGGAPFVRFLGARIAMANQDFTGAVSDLQRLVVDSPDFTIAKFLLGAVLLSQGNLQQADVQLSQVVQSMPDNLEARKLLARVRLRLEQPEAAIQVLLPAAQGDTADAQVGALMGVAQMQAGNAGAAIASLEQSLARAPRNDALRDDLAAAYLREGQSSKALSVLAGGGDPSGARRVTLYMTALVAANGTRAANVEIDRLLKKSTADVDLMNIAAGFYLRQSDFVRSRALLTQALTVKPADPETLTSLARVEMAAGNLDIAAASLDRAQASDPGYVPARVASVELAARRGDTATAIKQLEAWRGQDRTAVEPRLRLVQHYLASNQDDRVETLLKECLAVAPSSGPIYNAMGLIYLDAGRYDQAVARFRAATDADSANVAFWLNLGRAHGALDQRPAARDAVDRALALDPESVAAVGTAALMDLGDGNRGAAESRIKALQTANPKDPAVWALEGDIRMAGRQYPEASSAFDRALALQQNSASAVKAYRARQLGKLPDPTEPLSRWLVTHPEDVSVRSVLAEAYQLTGQRSRAVAEYELLVSNGLKAPSAFNNLAWLYHQAGDKRAVEMSRQAYAMAPQVPAIADTHGWILVQQGQVQEGLKLLEKALLASPENPEIGFHHAAALAKAGSRDDARRRIEALLERYPSFDSRGAAQRLADDLGS